MILWPWDGLVRPIRSYFERKNRTRWKKRRSKGICSSCQLPFDNGKKRCVVDSCGHQRCYACLYAQDTCPVCLVGGENFNPQDKLKWPLINEKHDRLKLNKSLNRKRLKLGDVQNFEVDYEEMKRFSQISNISSKLPLDVPFLDKSANSVTLKPLYFEVPQSAEECSFLYRDWIFEKICEIITTTNLNGVILEGIEGSGKTSLILQLVEWSSFGCKRKSAILNDVTYTSWDTLMKLSSFVVGYHFCHEDCRETCLIPDFIHSLAAQLCQAPQLEEYRNLVTLEESYQDLLSLEACIENPDVAFQKGVLEPLATLNNCAAFPSILVIDSIHESQRFQRSISSFLASHLKRFPSWLKVIMTVNSDYINDTCAMPFHRINLNCEEPKVKEDLLRYICCRVKKSPTIETNISTYGNENHFLRFAEYLVSREKSSFLFVKLILDLIEQNYLVVKSTTFNVIPVSLDEIFLLTFNLRFPSTATFSKVKPILEVCLAALNPLTASEIFYSLESASVRPCVSWLDFTETLNLLSGILIQRRDQSLMLSYASLRRWLKENIKFRCDVRFGHTYLALLSTRLRYPLSSEKELEFIYYIIRSNLFEDQEQLKFLWLQSTSINLSRVLVNPRVIFSLDEQLVNYVLKIGANPNSTLVTFQKYPVLNCICKLGIVSIVSSFLNFGANPNMTDVFGVTALMEAAMHGHLATVEKLISVGAKIHLKDKAGRCALYWAAEKGHLAVVELLLKSNSWPSLNSCFQAKQRALIAAAGINNSEMCKYLLKATSSEKENKMIAFPHEETCEMLLKKNIKPENLYEAAASGHIQTIRILFDKGVSLDIKDEYGRTALAWACTFGKIEVVRFLIEKGADITTKDIGSCNLLHIAAVQKNKDLVTLLLQAGVDVEARNFENKTPLECAIAEKICSSVNMLLEAGASIGPEAFKLAHGNPKLYSILLNKLLNEGISLYQNGDIIEASHRFEFAWDKVNKEPNFEQIRTHLQKGLYLCKCKLK